MPLKQKSKKRILFLGETYRADAITWIKGLEQFGDFEVVTWELKNSSNGISRIQRILELIVSFFSIRKIAKKHNPDMIIAERTTSYGFLAALSGVKPIAIAQQGFSDLWPENSLLYYPKKIVQDYAFKKATLIHAWGPVMAEHMYKSKVPQSKILILPKGIDLSFFAFNNQKNVEEINAIVTRSLLPEYQHEIILKAFGELKRNNIPFNLTIVGDGMLFEELKLKAKKLNINDHVNFIGRIQNKELPKLLMQANIYISMPSTEGVSASLFEAMACGCFPIVSDLPGNKSWINQHKNGILVPSTDYKKLAQEIEYVKQNQELQKNVIEFNRRFVEENINYNVNMKKIAETYHQLINEQL